MKFSSFIKCALNSTSPWCAALSETDLLVLEYIRDLKHYYKDGYGFDIDWMQECNPIVDVFNYFKYYFIVDRD